MPLSLVSGLWRGGPGSAWGWHAPGPAGRRKTLPCLETLEGRHLLSAGISGFVFNDANNNGLFNPGEGPVADVRVELRDPANRLAGVAVTDRHGYYEFAHGLCPEAYTIVLPRLPGGAFFGKESSNGRVLPAQANVPAIPVVYGYPSRWNHECDEPDADEDDPPNGVPHNDFGVLLPARLVGRVFAASAGDSLRRQLDALAGVDVTLTGSDDRGRTLTLSTTTTTAGFYRFTGLRPGRYLIVTTPPAGYRGGGSLIGTLGGTAANQSVFLVVGPGAAGADYNFIELRQVTPFTVAHPPPALAASPVLAPGVVRSPQRPALVSLEFPAVVSLAGAPGAHSPDHLRPDAVGTTGSTARGDTLGSGSNPKAEPPSLVGDSGPSSDAADVSEATAWQAPAAPGTSFRQCRFEAFSDEEDAEVPCRSGVDGPVVFGWGREAQPGSDHFEEITPVTRSRGQPLLCAGRPEVFGPGLLITSLWVLGMAVANVSSTLDERSPTAAAPAGRS